MNSFVQIGLLIFVLSTHTHVFCELKNVSESCVELYEKGVESYLENNYSDCVTYLERALLKYKIYSNNIRECRLKCKSESELSEPLYKVDIENLLFFEKTLKNTLCLVKCKANFTDDFEKYHVNEKIIDIFENKKPYEYLHICYFQIKDVQKAASSVFTYLVSHPDDKIMSATLKHYSTIDGVNMNDIINYEAEDYVYLYNYGVKAYEEKRWNDAINNMEESLQDFLQAEEQCRAQCEGPFDHGWYPDFIPAIANHFTYCLKCKTSCYSKLSSLNGAVQEDLLPSHYHYLQYAYYKVGKIRKACEAVESYLLFFPKDENMLYNKEFYSNLSKENTDFFTPRPEALKYVQRRIYERKLLKFIENEFRKLEINIEDNSKEFPTELKGINKLVSNNLLTTKQCKTFVEILKTFSTVGDGYELTDPHSKFEKFEGISLEKFLLLVYFGLLKETHLRMLLDVTEKAKTKISDYFKLNQSLHITYTHLVCRTTIKGSPEIRNDLSHEIHADNCNIHPDGICEKKPPSYTWRDYSAIMYLNDDFEGGEFFFSSNMSISSIQHEISPSCGKMVAFSSGKENLHGVKAVRKGSRCALAIWFTFNPEHKEPERKLAQNFLNRNM